MLRYTDNKPERPTALVTGGSRGIGLELAKEFARNGHDLVLVARGKESLESVSNRLTEEYGCRVTAIPLDLTAEGAPADLFRQVQEQGVRIDVLVNNAGIADYGSFSDRDSGNLAAMLQLNIVGLSLLTRLFLPDMIERGSGRILNVASVVAFFAGAPNWAAYVASKQYVLALTRGLRGELRGTGVSVTALCPGPAETGFADLSGVGRTRAYRWLPKVHPSAVARKAYRGTMAGRCYVIPGLLNKVNAVLGELPPRGIAQAVLSLLLSTRPASGQQRKNCDEDTVEHHR